jgi:4-amino-4-deoxy-L-arabinose transferase-like glycosyltransferase
MEKRKITFTPSSRVVYLCVLVVVAFALRLSAVMALRDIHAGPTHQLGSDSLEYDELARNLVQGNGYELTRGHPSSWRAPGFPFFLAAVYLVAGIHPAAAYLSFCLLGALSCVFTYLLARELLPESWSRVIGMLSAIYVPNIYQATTFWCENFFVPLLAVAVWLIVRYLRTERTWLLVTGGAALGLCSLTRGNAVLLLPIFLVILAGWQWARRQWRPGPTVAFAVAFLAVIVPWSARNWRIHQGRMVMISTVGGSTFYGGNNDRVLNEPKYLGYWTLDDLPGRSQIVAIDDEIEQEQMNWTFGKQWVREHLADMPKLCFYKLVRMWIPDIASDNRRYKALQLIGYTPFLLLYLLAGLRFCRSKVYWTAPWMVLHAVMLAALAITVVFFGAARYRDSNLPVLMVYAGIGLEWIWSWISQRRGQRDAASSTATLSDLTGRANCAHLP